MRTVEEIYNEMLGVFRRETGAEASAVSELSVKLYAVAAQVHGLYAQAEWLSRQCFPQTAQGEYLDRHAALRGVERRGAVRARGSLRFLVDTPVGHDLTISAGTVCATAGLTRFETLEDGVLKAGEAAVDIPAQAAEPGEGGNVPAGSVLVMTVPPVGVRSCVNPAPFLGGVDVEEDEALRQRVLETYRRMPNGANAAFYEQGALSFGQVAACAVLPRQRGIGTVDVVVSTRAGVPEEALLAKLQGYFEERREIAVDVKVKVSRGTDNPDYQEALAEAWLFVSENMYVGDFSYSPNYSTRISGAAIGMVQFDQVYTIRTGQPGGYNPAGTYTPFPAFSRKYFLRFGARTTRQFDGTNRYNYTTVKEFTTIAR